jgi:hypothetical protein
MTEGVSRGWCAAAWLMVALITAPVSAQTGEGRITGIVTDAQGAALSGAMVTAASPSLIGDAVVLSENDGRYRFPALPSGGYSIRFELDGFRPVTREPVIVTLGSTTTVDVQLEIGPYVQAVNVSAAPPLVDVTTTKTGTSFTGIMLLGVPNATDMWSVLAQTPGIRMQGFDVGGSHKHRQSDYETFGIAEQNRILADGVDVTEGTGGAGGYWDYFALEEISVSALGGDVEMNTPGAAVSFTVKSGGDRFRGLAHFSYEGEWLVGDNIDAATAARGFTGQPTLLFWEGHADLGGPIVRQKAWFFGAANHFTIDRVISGIPREIATDRGIFGNYTGKATYTPGRQNTLTGYTQITRKQSPNVGLSAGTPAESGADQDTPGWTYKAEHQRVWTNRLFTDVRTGTWGYRSQFVPKTDPAVNPPRTDLATGLRTGANPFTNTGARHKPQLMTQAAYFLPRRAGSHDFKLGIEVWNDILDFANNGLSGPINYRDLNGQTSQIRFLDVGRPQDLGKTWTGSDDRDFHSSAYVQDRWAATSRITLTAGVRVDRQRPHYMDATRDPVLKDIYPATSRIAGATLLTVTDVSPRLGVATALNGAKTAVLKALVGRYYNNFADAFLVADPAGFNRRIYVFSDLNANRLYDGPQELGRLILSDGGGATAVSPGLHTPFTDEISISLERQFRGASSARATYVRKISRRAFDVLIPAWTDRLTVEVPAEVESDRFGREAFRLYDIPPAAYDFADDTQFDNIPDGRFTYDTLEFAYARRAGTRIVVQGSFDYQWRNELKAAASEPNPYASDPIPTAYFLNPHPAVPNRQKTTNWQSRVLARVELTRGLGIAVNARAQSGFAYSRIATAELPGLGDASFFVENLAAHRSDTTALVDVRADKSFRLRGAKVSAIVGVYNVTNSNAVTNFFVTTSNFGDIISTLDPRTVQLAARLQF